MGSLMATSWPRQLIGPRQVPIPPPTPSLQIRKLQQCLQRGVGSAGSEVYCLVLLGDLAKEQFVDDLGATWAVSSILLQMPDGDIYHQSYR